MTTTTARPLDLTIHPPQMEWDDDAFHPHMYKEPGRRAAAACNGLADGWYRERDIALALVDRAGVSLGFAGNVAARIAKACGMRRESVAAPALVFGRPGMRRCQMVLWMAGAVRNRWPDLNVAESDWATLRVTPVHGPSLSIPEPA